MMAETMVASRLSRLLRDYYDVGGGSKLDVKTNSWMALMDYVGKKRDFSNWTIGDDLMTLVIEQYGREMMDLQREDE